MDNKNGNKTIPIQVSVSHNKKRAENNLFLPLLLLFTRFYNPSGIETPLEVIGGLTFSSLEKDKRT